MAFVNPTCGDSNKTTSTPVILGTLENIEKLLNYIHYNPAEAEIVFQERNSVNRSFRNYE